MARTKGGNIAQKVMVNRILAVDSLIREGGFPNAATLAKKLEMTPRTIQRDIEYMRDMYSAPIEYDYDHRGYYYSEPNFFIKSVLLTEGEFFSITLFDQMLEQYRNTPLEDDLRRIFAKIAQSLPATLSVQSAFLTNQMSFIPDAAGQVDSKVFKVIFTALKTKSTITFDYQPLSKETYMKRTVDPYHAISQKGNWYVIGLCHDKNEPRMFTFSRIQNAALTKKHFTIPPTFNANDYFDREMGVWASSREPVTVELLFDKTIRTFAIDRQWHSGQTVEQRKDGSVYVKFTTTQMPEVLRWVLGQGHTVKVLGPRELVDMVRDEAGKVRGMYE
ncbi:WYL domain-containing protein [Spirochaetia bacterium]|nr:WYL domain-containing protein [Spirochaetia bacterium]GHU30235.1 WYL domain-containing protein [Spirochaetia bacterium]